MNLWVQVLVQQTGYLGVCRAFEEWVKWCRICRFREHRYIYGSELPAREYPGNNSFCFTVQAGVWQFQVFYLSGA
jgi:hypothetical protein